MKVKGKEEGGGRRKGKIRVWLEECKKIKKKKCKIVFTFYNYFCLNKFKKKTHAERIDLIIL